MPDLITQPDVLIAQYRSHPDKLLYVHTDGVMEGVISRTSLASARIAALFHDVGKLNPNFQAKLDYAGSSAYSHHAYLSAHAFLCFCKFNPQAARDLGISKKIDVFLVVALIAHHHGNLPNLSRILCLKEREALEEFLGSTPALPASTFVRLWIDHNTFELCDSHHRDILKCCATIPDSILQVSPDRLDLFMETQFAFACLVEADKRDAGDNKRFFRSEDLGWAQEHFHESVTSAVLQLSGSGELNAARTAMREEACRSLENLWGSGERVFSLTAPTGSGKTMALLSLADHIRRHHPDHSVVYAMPFLTITEQVEGICRESVFTTNPAFVTRIDSRSEDGDLDSLLADLETHPERVGELIQRSFSRDTFDFAFIVTTFVQLFETLLSNRGGSLLRLPNFAGCIFLIDEIQALPPRLYVFLTAYLQAFCEKFDSYAVLSTATMPALCLPAHSGRTEENASRLFTQYHPPAELLVSEKYYQMTVFDRYIINRISEHPTSIRIEELAQVVRDQKCSCLVILNTIDDTRKLYDLLSLEMEHEELELLNTRFILDDRLVKLQRCKQRLDNNERIILISTQLIEAGVDVDFPMVFRDLCPLSGLIQSAGRCNRSGKRSRGIVWFFELLGESGKSRSELVYRDPADAWILDFARQRINNGVCEKDLLEIQRQYFKEINRNLYVGAHPLWADGEKRPDNLVRRINEEAFEVVGSFRLIDEQAFGIELRYYVPSEDADREWEKLQHQTREAAALRGGGGSRPSFEEVKKSQISIDAQLRRMAGRMVQFRVYHESAAPPAERNRNGITEVCGIRKLLLPEIHYSAVTGIETAGGGVAIL